MPVELRQRKAHQQPAAPAVKSTGKVAKSTKAKPLEKVKAMIKGKKAGAAVDADETIAKAPAAAASSSDGKSVGDVIALESFGGEVEMNDGEKTTLKQLVDESGSGVVLFTYPKASTPGCTKQVCFFRDSYTPLTATGLAIYGLSADSPKANTTFKTKQNLPYPLLCDPKQTLISAIGLKKKPGPGTQRGVWVVNKEGKVLVSEAGGPEPTMLRVKKLVEEGA